MQLTFVIAGGKRPATAAQRAARIFERIANHAARLSDVVELTAAAGHSSRGEMSWPQHVRFAAANCDDGSGAPRKKFSRYVDPDRQHAKTALAAANAAAKARRDADHRRRTAVGCRNARPSILDGPRVCECAYCQPEEHLLAVQNADDAWVGPRCLCGERVPGADDRCLAHRGAELEFLDGDRPELRAFAVERRHGHPSLGTGSRHERRMPTI